MAVLDVLQAIFPVAFPVVWVGGAVILFFRFRVKQFDYLHQSPRVNDKALGMFVVRNPIGRDMRAVYGAMIRRQDDPDLEALRRAMWRSYSVMAVWIILFPFVTACVLLVLYALDIVPTH